MFSNTLRTSLIFIVLALLGICIWIFKNPILGIFGAKKIEGQFKAQCEKVEQPFTHRLKDGFYEDFIVYFSKDGMMQYGIALMGIPSPVIKYRIKNDFIFVDMEGEKAFLKIIDENTLEGYGCIWHRVSDVEVQKEEMKKSSSAKENLKLKKNKQPVIKRKATEEEIEKFFEDIEQ